ncbi:MAG: sulfotransferase [Xanthomonadaceae bacterium]|nr:sulfotransferase [Xanthomonadaceae bacterium]MDE1957678.1 sulfotransferase [Xanthomonadaceae bacterium]
MASYRSLERARHYIDAGQPDAARICLEGILQREPGNPDALHLLLRQLLIAGHARRPAELALAAAGYAVDSADHILRAATDLMRVGEFATARRILAMPLLDATAAPEHIFRHAQLRSRAGEHEHALRLLEQASRRGMESPALRSLRGQLRMYCADFAGARADYEALQDADPADARAALALVRLHQGEPAPAQASAIERAIPLAEEGDRKAALHFALFEELHALRRYAQAWSVLQSANAAMRRVLAYDGDQEQQLLDSLMRRCTPEFIDARPVEDSPDGPVPIFVIGLPRSGTTLLDRLLGSHPKITSAGELGDFSYQMGWATDHDTSALLDIDIVDRAGEADFQEVGRRYRAQTGWRAQGRPFFIDKLPANFLLAGFIAKALPEARLLHVVRDPMDVCFSNFRAFFGYAYAYSYNLDDIAAHHARYRRLMAHWHAAMPGRILDVDYAQLATDPQSTLRRVLDFCGLTFDVACLDPMRNNAAPTATLSAVQIRGAIRPHRNAWQPYSSDLAQLQRALEQSPTG